MTDRVKTGIPGFDRLVGGGLLKNSINLVSGGAGTGKTIFCLQFLWNGVKMFNENGLYFSFEESVDDLKADAKVFNWDFSKYEKKCKLFYISPYSIENFESILEQEVSRIKSKRVVIDPTSILSMSLENNFEVRKQLYLLSLKLKQLGCTSIITSEIVGETPLTGESIGKLSRFDVEEFVCDSVVTMHYAGIGGIGDRAIRIVKMRKTDHAKGPIPLKITNDGIKVIAKGIRF